MCWGASRQQPAAESDSQLFEREMTPVKHCDSLLFSSSFFSLLPPSPGDDEKTGRLEAEVQTIRSRMEALERQLALMESRNPIQRVAKLEETVRNVQVGKE